MTDDIPDTWQSRENDIMQYIREVVEETSYGETPESFYTSLEDDLCDLKESYDLVDEEVLALAREVTNRVEVKPVLIRADNGAFYVRFVMQPRE